MLTLTQRLVILIWGLLLSQVAFAVTYQELPSDFRTKWEVLLHYANGKSDIEAKSDFFLTNKLHPNTVDPADELAATIEFFNSAPEHGCLYPARYRLIYGTRPQERCPDFKEYLDYVAMDSIKLVFATESALNPVSAMGHIFLVATGQNAAGITKSHGIGYVADSNKQGSLLLAFLADSIDGSYVLNPYDDLIYNYVSDGHRSLWEYELDLTADEKEWLYLHIYELKAHSIHYSFFTNNCATGLQGVLTVASSDFTYKGDGGFDTPAAYARYIRDHSNRIKDVSVRPTSSDQVLINRGKMPEALPLGGTTRFDTQGIYSSQHASGLRVSILPVIRKLEDASPFTGRMSESRFLEPTLRITKNSIYLEELTIFNIRNLPDITRSSLLPSLGLELHGDIETRHTSLYPDLHAGLGLTFGTNTLMPFIEATGGIHIEHAGANWYLAPRGGVIMDFPGSNRLILSASSYTTSHEDYRGYRYAFEGTYSYMVNSNLRFGGSAKYFMAGDKDQTYLISAGINYRFW